MRLLLFSLVCAVGCAPPTPEEALWAITDGTLDSGHPSVGQLLVPSKPNDYGSCTGTLVGERTVLTAAHCLPFEGDFMFLVGGGAYAVAHVVHHPEYDPALPKMPPDHDIGLALLERAPPVAPSPVSDDMPRVGSTVVLVGFGTTGETADDGGIKRTAVNVVAQVEPARFAIDGSGNGVGNLCHGDSGGPALFGDVEQRVVGVTSAAEGQCGKSRSWDTRVDVYLDWLRSVTGDLRLPDRDPPRIIITTPTDGATLRAPVTVEAEVIDVSPVQQVTLRVDDAQVASATAASARFEQDLAPGGHALEVRAVDLLGHEGVAGLTVNVVAGDLPVGAACTLDIECAGERCFVEGDDGEGLCTRPCDPEGDPCPGDLVCREPAPGQPPLCLVAKGDLGGGCAVGESGSGPSLLLILGMLVLWRRRARHAP